MKSSLIWEEGMMATGTRSQEGKSNNPGFMKKDSVLTIYYLTLASQVAPLPCLLPTEK